MTGCDNFFNRQIEMPSVSLAEMETKVQSQDWLIVDARDSDWFNGWPSAGDSVGGHIPGARNFDLAWMSSDQTAIDSLMETKGIDPSQNLIVYGKDKQDAQVLAQWLVSEQGFSKDKVFVYEEGFSSWLEQGGQPDKLPGYRQLVTPEWLEGHRKTIPDLKILDVSWGKGARYLLRHIPGALHMDTGAVESEPLWNINEPHILEERLLSLGVTRKTPVVIYGDDMSAAARMLFVLKYAGVQDVRLLNGGWQAWESAGLPVETGINRAEPAERFGATVPTEPDLLVSTREVEELLEKDDEYLVSIRSWPEYTGETSGYTYIEPMGRIPGAVWGKAGSDPYHMEDYLNPDNTLREFRDLKSYWDVYEIEKDDGMTFYCGTGWRASLAWFAAELMGYTDASVYDGGWYEWSSDPSRPVDAG